MTFDQAMALQVLEGHTHVSPEAWYVALVAQHAVNTGELRVPDDYLFSIDPPNPDIMSLFAQQMAPQLAAERLFSTQH